MEIIRDPKVKRPNIKYALMRYLEKYDGPFGVLLSGGLDSHAVLFSLLELGHTKKNITVYSVAMEDFESRDFKAARHTAEVFGLPFTPVLLPRCLDTLKRDMHRNVTDLRTSCKVEVEAFWAIRRCIDAGKEKYMTGGLAADIYFALSKTGCMHYRHKVDEYRVPKFEKVIGPDSQTSKLKAYCRTLDRQWLSPWVTRGMLKEFLGTSWDDVNKPKQKQPVRTQFADYLEQVKIFNHTDMHKGDSGIAAHFEALLDDPEWNAHKGTSVVGVYNRLIRGDLLPPGVKKKRPKGILDSVRG